MVELKLFLMPPLKRSGRLGHDSSFRGPFYYFASKTEFDEMPLNAVKTHQGQLRRVALGKCIYLKIG